MNSTGLRIGRGRFSGHLAETARALVVGLRRHALLYALSIGALIIAFVAATLIDRLFDIELVVLFSVPIFVLVGAGALWFVIREAFHLWWSDYQGGLLIELGRLIASDLLAPQRIANLLHASVLLSIFLSAFNTLKVLLPALNPFQWDPAFMEWVRIIHFGI